MVVEDPYLFKAHASARAKNLTTCSSSDPAYVPSVSSPHSACSPLSRTKGICWRSRCEPMLIEHAHTLNALQNLYHPERILRESYTNRLYENSEIHGNSAVISSIDHYSNRIGFRSMNGRHCSNLGHLNKSNVNGVPKTWRARLFRKYRHHFIIISYITLLIGDSQELNFCNHKFTILRGK